MNILMVAAENDALPKAKVGGIGDVVRDVPPALAQRNCKVSVVTPSHEILASSPNERKASIAFIFRGKREEATVYRVSGKKELPESPNVRHFVIDHPYLRGSIFHHDPHEAFATDASKYACFCIAVAEAIKQGAFGKIDCLHLHDWHAAFLLILRKYHKAYQASLKEIRTAYTIHNLGLQGIRPFKDNDSSLDAWYWNGNEFEYDSADLADPRYPDCLNPMAVGIRLSDAVHTVSPSYAEEILEPNDEGRGFKGGEGLEAILQTAKRQGRLFGILNGCEYPEGRVVPKLNFSEFLSLLKSQVLKWIEADDSFSSNNWRAYTRLIEISDRTTGPSVVLAIVSRAAAQKVQLMMEKGADNKSSLQTVLESIGENAVCIALSSTLYI